MDQLSYGPRISAMVFVLLYVLYHAVLGLGYLDEYGNLALSFLALGLYLVSGFASVLFYRRVKIPNWLAVSNLSVVAIVPVLVNSMIEPSAAGSYATWYVVGLGTLMGITAIRGHKVIGWIGFILVAVQVIAWGGLGTLLNSGIIGALLMVFVGHASGYAINRAQREAKEFADLAKSREIRAAVQTAARSERNVITKETLKQARPLLNSIVESRGNLSSAQRQQAMLLEAELRDRIRGRMLISPGVEKAAREARARGVRVEILDEGGLDDLGADQREQRLDRVAQLLSGVTQGKVTIRAPHSETWRISVVAFSSESDAPDIWERIP